MVVGPREKREMTLRSKSVPSTPYVFVWEMEALEPRGGIARVGADLPVIYETEWDRLFAKTRKYWDLTLSREEQTFRLMRSLGLKTSRYKDNHWYNWLDRTSFNQE